VLDPHVLRYRCDGPLPAKRRNEFVTVRYCARQALGELGLPPGNHPSNGKIQ